MPYTATNTLPCKPPFKKLPQVNFSHQDTGDQTTPDKRTWWRKHRERWRLSVKYHEALKFISILPGQGEPPTSVHTVSLTRLLLERVCEVYCRRQVWRSVQWDFRMMTRLSGEGNGLGGGLDTWIEPIALRSIRQTSLGDTYRILRANVLSMTRTLY